MITYKTRLGEVSIAEEYFSKLIGQEVAACYGVASMIPKRSQRLREILSRKEVPDKGIYVRGDSAALLVDVHITVTYGVNINTIAKSIMERVTYTVEHATGIDVKRVVVYVDGMKTA